MENTLNFKVQYCDTDAYGVVWHGSYLRWMEQGRVELLFNYGLEIHKMQLEQDIVMPVVEIDIKYKHSARLMDEVILKTKIEELNKTSVMFLQEIILKETGKICTTAHVRAVALQKGKIMRTLDEFFKEKV